MPAKTDGRKITRDDLQQAFSQLLGEGETTARSAVPQAAVLGAGLALAVVALAYLAGRRKGRRRSAILEVRRV